MWTKTIIGLSVILGTIALALSNHYASIGNRDLEFAYLIGGVALLVLAALLTVIQLAHWWFGRRYMRRPVEGVKDDQPLPLRHKEKFKFGVVWDSDLSPLCPVCRTPLTLSTKKLMYPIDPINNTIPPPSPIPHCLKCNEALPLYDDDGRHVTLVEAKKLLSEKKSEKAIDTPESKPLLAEAKTAKDDDFEPDETDRRLLAYLFKDGVDRDLGSIVKALNFAHTQEAKFHLERLIKNRYVDPPKPFRASRRLLPGYSITQKGREFVMQHNLHREGVRPTPPEPQPLQLQTANTAKPADFKPDELCLRIMELIKRTPSLTLLVEVVEALKVDIILIAPRLDKLLTHKYVTRLNEHPMSPLERSPYILTPKGREYVDKYGPSAPPQPKTTAATQSAEAYKPDETDIKILVLIGQGNAWESQIGDALKLRHSEAGLRIRNLEDHGYVELVRPKNRAPYHQLTDKGIEFLGDTPNYTIPHPGGHDIIDEQKKAILMLLANPEFPSTDRALSVTLPMHLVRIQLHLSELMQHDYVFQNGFDEYGDPLYGLNTKAKRFLIDRNLID